MIALHRLYKWEVAVQMGVSAEVEEWTISFGKGGDNKENGCSAAWLLQIQIPTCLTVICLDNSMETNFSFCYPGSDILKIWDGEEEKLSFRLKKSQIKQQINKLCVVRHCCCIPKSVISYEVYQKGWNVYTSVVAKFLLGELSSIFLNPFGIFCWRKKKGLPCAEALDCTQVEAHALSPCMVPIWKGWHGHGLQVSCPLGW